MNEKFDHILFLDIETVPQVFYYSDLDDHTRALFEAKVRYMIKEDTGPEEIYKKAGVYAEFGKIVCISCGFLVVQDGIKQFRIKSYYGDDEKKLLMDFSHLLEKSFHEDHHRLCAHNGKEFDFPYLCRRMIINGLKIPAILGLQNKKPWEVQHLDTMEMWKFGDYKHYTSLDLLTAVLGLPSPKDDIKGSDVGRVYWEEGDVEKIRIYCQKDVLALVQVYLRLRGQELFPESNIIFVND